MAMSHKPTATNTFALSENGAAALADALRIARDKTLDDKCSMIRRHIDACAEAYAADQRGDIERTDFWNREANSEQYRIDKADNLLTRYEDLASMVHNLALTGDAFAPLDD